ncbi:MAG TPA: energy transducer TonB, partial [Pyrinomonadaceae bacterium]|nr:energy transducer TonB [Pyrinomonadaceae bacterium]
LSLISILPVSTSAAQTSRIAILGVEETGSRFAGKFRQELSKHKTLRLIDDDLSRASMRGLKLENLFNLSLEEARTMGAVIDCDFYFIVKSNTLRRSSSLKNVYYESFAVVFLVSARSGRLLNWQHSIFEADKPEEAEKLLLENAGSLAANFTAKLIAAAAQEQIERSAPIKTSTFVEISDAENAQSNGIRIPLPYKRLRPVYTEAAKKADAEATVDVRVDLNAAGAIERVEVLRWAGFGLDEETIETVKKMQFRPALRNEEPIPARFLLRYNFRDSKE